MTGGVSAQNEALDAKLNELISTLNETKFIRDYSEYKNDAEALANEVKQAQGDPKEVAKLKISYGQSKFRFQDYLAQV